MKRITFKYRDEYCKDGRFNIQTCIIKSIEDCIKFYGLDKCEYEILEVEDIQDEEY